MASWSGGVRRLGSGPCSLVPAVVVTLRRRLPRHWRCFAPVATPIDLLATPYANGAVVVKWDRNGNAKSTAYALEAKYGVSETWVPVVTTGKTKVSLTGFTPGDQVTFRVFANRGGVTSAPSIEYVIYPNSDAQTITLAEAA